MQTTEINAAIRPYSMAVTPDSSCKKRVTVFILSSSVIRLLPSGAARCREQRDRLPRPRIIHDASCIQPKALDQILAFRGGTSEIFEFNLRPSMTLPVRIIDDEFHQQIFVHRSMRRRDLAVG